MDVRSATCRVPDLDDSRDKLENLCLFVGYFYQFVRKVAPGKEETCHLQTIRAWLERNEDWRPGWLGALSDPDIGRALVLIHRRAEEPWTVASLAREVHLSRSVFAERFSRLVGMPPMQYLTRWRMSLARSWLREERMSVSEAAHRLGYSSEAAFSRAFKRHLQVPPGVLRRGGAPGRMALSSQVAGGRKKEKV